MTRPALLAALAASLVLTSCAAGTGPRRFGEERFVRANPTRVIATELAFARAAQEKGQWTAFAEYAADDAVMFVPEPVNAKEWLRKQPNPSQAVRWQPHQVWSSCDGTLAIAKGAWQRPDGSVGYFTTVWERQRNGEHRWVLDQGDALEQPLAAPEMIGGKVADCPTGAERPARRERARPAVVRPTACAGGQCRGGGTSGDGTLTYDYAVTSAGRQLTVRLREAGAMREVLRSEVAAD